jgi:immunoglobulin-binding protein 1
MPPAPDQTPPASADDPAPPTTLQAAWTAAESQRALLLHAPTQNDPAYQTRLARTLAALDALRDGVSRAALFSTNESLDDVATRELRFLLVDARHAELVEKTRRGERAEAEEREGVLRESREGWVAFLERARAYGLLDKEQEGMWERVGRDGDGFEVVQAGMEAGRRREARIAGFRAEKELKAKLEVCDMAGRDAGEADAGRC